MRNTRTFLLFLALISLGALLVFNFFLVDGNEDQKLIKHITQEIQRIENEFNQDFLQLLLKNRPDEEFSFTNLTIDSFHSYYLFTESGKLVYWSDFSYMPDFDWINSKTNQRIMEDKRGIFYSKVRRFSRNNQGYWIVQLYPLYFKRDFQNQYLESGFNTEIFSNIPKSISYVQEEGFLDVKGSKGEFLFSVYFDPEQIPTGPSSQLALMIFFFSLFFLVLLMTRNLILNLWRKGKQVKALVAASAVLITIRALMLVFRFPKDYFGYRLFDPSGYASSWFNPSLGDLFLNVICLAILLALVLKIIAGKSFKNRLNKRRIKIDNRLFLIIAYLFSTLFLVLFYALYIDILSNSQWDLNILSLPSLDWFKIVSLSIVFVGGAAYFLFTVLALELVFYNNPLNKSKALSIIIYFSIPIVGTLAYFNWIWMVAYFAHFIFLVAVINFNLYRYIFTIGLNTFLTFFFGCLIAAIITGVASHQVYLERNFKSKASFGTEMLVENDILAEFFLSDIMERISQDLFIKNSMTDPLMRKEPIEQKIRKIHMNNYFDQYVLKVKAFNYFGENILDRNNSNTLAENERQFVKSDFATSVRDLYFIPKGTEGDGNQYFAFIPMFKQDVFVGTVFLELRQLRIVPGSVFPKLLIDEKYMAGMNDKKFDYAVYEEGELKYGVGLFNYRAAGIENLLNQSTLFTSGIYKGKFHHVGVKELDKVVVVSSPVYPIYYILADISLFFLGFIIFTLGSLIFGAFSKEIGSLRFNYATKLQLYLNFAFFFPILIISLIIVGLFTGSYQEELHRQYLQKTSLVTDNLSPVIEKKNSGILEKDELLETMNNLSGNANTDINLYSKQGVLVSTSQPNIFDKKVLTNYINPNAIVELVEGQNNLILLEEKIGNLTFKSVYSAIRSKDGQEVQAIVAVPFFESETELDLLIADVLSNIINIFVLVFIVFLFISYFVSKNLTFPFKLLTQKLKVTGLDNNEPMYWPTNDEIGLLVNEYNNMLFKLDASKKDLANSEKESAWREMAKQVAHEIKNPLTPMKLTLQHLLRLQSEGKLDDPKKLKQPLETLIHQVDTLSDIATSFSSFAKMPQPKKELMDFKQVVLGTLELFKNRENEKIIFGDLSEEDNLPVMGDKQLFGRIIANLIINGFQATEPHKKSVILVFLRVIEEQVVLEIKDNGKGIPMELRDKIFMPNFSTKSEGSGLGLAIAKRGVETEGGKIWFETEEGKGTSFFLSFNLVAEIPV
ncbi:ATP-binding protein [Aquiflexum sp. LQ15W]|uniref:ATP-binding protein n=1 Tax=Cognataquiflexum nitidum TaxID=2922272 RepID=UPI001F147089|nr:ATP-binding protein [Cognataquiflexum nitidum]MCH6200372.1 ATP-binding protein [Cognataquiflexum nitidum]